MPHPASALRRSIPSLISRKLTAAAVASVVIALALGLRYAPDGLAPGWQELLGLSSILLLYVVPVVYIYGVAASMAAEMALSKLLPRPWLHALLSLPLHACFGYWGLRLLASSTPAGVYGAVFAVIYFMADFALSRLRGEYTASHAVPSFIFLPLALFFLGVVCTRF